MNEDKHEISMLKLKMGPWWVCTLPGPESIKILGRSIPAMYDLYSNVFKYFQLRNKVTKFTIKPELKFSKNI